MRQISDRSETRIAPSLIPNQRADRGHGSAGIAEGDPGGCLGRVWKKSPTRVSTSGNTNSPDGRDHWPHCYTASWRVPGSRGRHLWGNRTPPEAALPENPVHPTQIVATIYHALGIDPHTIVMNHLNQPRELVQAGASPWPLQLERMGGETFKGTGNGRIRCPGDPCAEMAGWGGSFSWEPGPAGSEERCVRSRFRGWSRPVTWFQRGTTNDVVLSGEALTGVQSIWVTGEGVSASPGIWAAPAVAPEGPREDLPQHPKLRRRCPSGWSSLRRAPGHPGTG